MGDVTFSGVQSLPDFLLDNQFNLVFSKMPAVSGITSDDINMRTVTFTPPQTIIAYAELTMRGFKKQQPSVRQPNQEITIELCETIDMKTHNFLTQWRELCAKRGNNYVAPASQREGEILAYRKNSQNTNVWAYKILNVCLSDFTVPPFADGSSPAVVKSELKLKYSDFVDGPNV
jgi:hypothetical protein